VTMAKVSMTFRIDSELAKRLKEYVAKSGGKLTQAEVIESSLADRFAVKDGTKLLAKVNQDQATALTLVKEQTEALEEFQEKVAGGINAYSKRLHNDVEQLERSVQQEMRGTVASVNAMQSQMASFIGTLRQVEYHVQQTAEARLSALHIVGLIGQVFLAMVGAAWLAVAAWKYFVG
jgi:hypothetical protein